MKRYELSVAQWLKIASLLPARSVIPDAAAPTIAYSSMAACEFYAQAPIGATCRSATVDGRRCTSASALVSHRRMGAAVRGAGGRPRQPISDDRQHNRPRPSAGSLRKRGQGSGAGALPRRTNHQDPHVGRCSWPTIAFHRNAWSGRRYHAGAGSLAGQHGYAVLADRAYDSNALRETPPAWEPKQSSRQTIRAKSSFHTMRQSTNTATASIVASTE